MRGVFVAATETRHTRLQLVARTAARRDFIASMMITCIRLIPLMFVMMFIDNCSAN